MPNLRLEDTFETSEAILVAARDPRVLELRDAHPNFDRFLSQFSNAHGVELEPPVLILEEHASEMRRTDVAMVGFRNCLSVSTIVKEAALDLQYPGRHRILFSDSFEFYPWMLDRDYEYMISITPAAMEVHQVQRFRGQPSAGTPVQPLRRFDVDLPLLTSLFARWEAAYSTRQMSAENRALFRALNMANAALAMPAVQGATILDYGRQCALWISAFEILAHFSAGRNKADFTAVRDLIEKTPFLSRRLRRRSYTIVYRGRSERVGLATKIYMLLYKARNDFLHGNPVTIKNLLLPWSGRPMWQFAPSLFRCALRNFLSLRFEDFGQNQGPRERLPARLQAFDFDNAQYDAEAALWLATSPPAEED